MISVVFAIGNILVNRCCPARPTRIRNQNKKHSLSKKSTTTKYRRPLRFGLFNPSIGERNSPEESFQELQVRVLGHRVSANIVADTASSRLKIDTHLLVCLVNI